jgi:hypothetical protein
MSIMLLQKRKIQKNDGLTLILKLVISFTLEGNHRKIHGCRQFSTITPTKTRNEKTP